jgi:hypothetical protein
MLAWFWGSVLCLPKAPDNLKRERQYYPGILYPGRWLWAYVAPDEREHQGDLLPWRDPALQNLQIKTYDEKFVH